MMKADVLKGNIPIRVEHENKFYSDIGVWKEADIQAGNKLFIKGEIDLELSMARDLEVLLRKGKKICMSVGGIVNEAVSEFVKEAGKYITTYKDITLYEVSIVKNPANTDTTLAIAKSFNTETKQETELAKSLSDSAKELIKIDSVVTTKTVKSAQELFKSIEAEVAKDWDDAVSPEYTAGTLSVDDLKYIAMFIEARKRLDSESYTWDEQMKLQEEIWEAEKANGGWLPDECYVTDLLPSRRFPHHNADYTLNKEWLKFQLWNIMNGEAWYLSPKEYKQCLSHLWMHFKMEATSEYQKKSVTEAPKENVLEKQMEEAEVTAIFKACYEYKVNKAGTRPQIEGNDLSDKEVSKMANAYKAINERFRTTQTVGSVAKSFYSLSSNNMTIEKKQETAEAAVEAKATAEAETVTTVAEAVATETPAVAEVPAVETPVVEAPVAPTQGVGITEKATEEVATDGAEDVTPVVTEEAGTDASLNNTGSEPVVATEVAKTEEAPAATEEAPAPVAEVTPEVTAPVEATPTVVTEETPVATSEVVKEETPTVSKEELLAMANAFTQKAIADALAPIAEAMASITKSIEDKEQVSKAQKETADSNFIMLQKSIEATLSAYTTVKSQIDVMNTSIAFRKSSAVVIEKKESENTPQTAADVNKAIADEMSVNGGEYAKARNTVIARLQASQKA